MRPACSPRPSRRGEARSDSVPPRPGGHPRAISRAASGLPLPLIAGDSSSASELPALPVVSVAPPGSRLVFFQNREAEHPALGGQSESGRGELRELHAARAAEVEISFARDEEIPPDVHDQGLAV